MDEFLTISQLTSHINQTLEKEFSRVRFEGEISQITYASSGHLYFTLKDKDSQVQAAMWRSAAARIRFKPKQGDFVQCVGGANLYNKSGRFQLIVQRMREAGEGALQKKYLELKAKLEEEGLFDAARKRTLPFFPRTIGIVTSESAAALQDMLVKLRERMPGTKVILAPARVQGEGAASEIAQAVKLLNKDARAQVLLVGRGGGSLEDLWAFNEEVVVRAIFASAIPVISAVGHEVDIALSDLVADVRAPTPTAAAEMVVPHRNDLLEQLASLESRLNDSERWLAPMQQLIDDLHVRFNRSLLSMLERARLRVMHASQSLKLLEPKTSIAHKKQALENLSERLNRCVGLEELKKKRDYVDQVGVRLSASTRRFIADRKKHVLHLRQQFDSLSHKRVLERGFSIVTTADGKLLRSATETKVGSELQIEFAKGSALVDVKKCVDEVGNGEEDNVKRVAECREC